MLHTLSLASHLYARLFSGHGLHVHDHGLSDSVAVEAVETVVVGDALGIAVVVGGGLGIEAAAPGIVGLGIVAVVVAVVVDIDWD